MVIVQICKCVIVITPSSAFAIFCDLKVEVRRKC